MKDWSNREYEVLEAINKTFAKCGIQYVKNVILKVFSFDNLSPNLKLTSITLCSKMSKQSLLNS